MIDHYNIFESQVIFSTYWRCFDEYFSITKFSTVVNRLRNGYLRDENNLNQCATFYFWAFEADG